MSIKPHPDMPETYNTPEEKEVYRWLCVPHATKAIKAAEKAGRKLSADEVLHMASIEMKLGNVIKSASIMMNTPHES